MSKLIFILQDDFHVARNIAFATVKSLTDIGNSSNTILFFIVCTIPPALAITSCFWIKKKLFLTTDWQHYKYSISIWNYRQPQKCSAPDKIVSTDCQHYKYSISIWNYRQPQKCSAPDRIVSTDWQHYKYSISIWNYVAWVKYLFAFYKIPQKIKSDLFLYN